MVFLASYKPLQKKNTGKCFLKVEFKMYIVDVVNTEKNLPKNS